MDPSATDSDNESMRGSFDEGANDPHETDATEDISGHASDLPPMEISRSHTTSDPSTLTVSSESTQGERATEMKLSARRVEYKNTEADVAVSVPVTTGVPATHQRNLTYQDGYDSEYSDGVIELVSAVIEPTNQPALETEVTQCTYPPDFIPRETL
jgi:hypothetical protein